MCVYLIYSEIPLSELNHDDGVKKLREKLKSCFAKNEVDTMYEIFVNFENLKKDETQSMTDYILAFDRIYERMKTLKMVLPDAVVACKMYSAGLSQSATDGSCFNSYFDSLINAEHFEARVL